PEPLVVVVIPHGAATIPAVDGRHTSRDQPSGHRKPPRSHPGLLAPSLQTVRDMQDQLETLSIIDLETVQGGTVQSSLERGANDGYGGLAGGATKGQRFGSGLLGFGGPVASKVGGDIGAVVGGVFGGIGGFLGGVGNDVYDAVTKK